jgi:hypothetical protein
MSVEVVIVSAEARACAKDLCELLGLDPEGVMGECIAEVVEDHMERLGGDE